MPQTYFLQNNFSSGELTPKLFSRGDLEQYNNGMTECTNWNVLTFGGIQTRPGSEFIGKAKQTAIRLIPFEFNTEQTYVIEAGNIYFRFYSDGLRILTLVQNITNVTNVAGKIRLTIPAHGFPGPDLIVVSGVLGTVEANGEWPMTVIDVNTVELTGSVFTNPYDTGGSAGIPLTVFSPFLGANTDDLAWVQDANELYLVDGVQEPQVLTRTSATTFSIAALGVTGGPFLPLNLTATTVSSSATTGAGVTLTASTSIFSADDVGRFFRMAGTTGSPAEQGYLEIVGFTSGTVVTADVKSDLSSGAATTNWAFGAFGGSGGQPTVIGFVQQRLVLAAGAESKETLFFSAVANITDFSVHTDDDRAFNVTIDSRTANVIRWIVGKGEVLVGTSGAEYSLSTINGAALTGTNVVVKEQTPYGSNNVAPTLVGNKVVYVNRSSRRVRAMGFMDEINEFDSPDFSLLAPHIFEDAPIIEMDYQQEPNTTLWTVLDSGDMASATILQEEKILAWSQHTFTNGTVRDVVSLPDDNQKEDEVYIAVQRTINSVATTYIERFRQVNFVDSYASGNVGGATTIYNLQHLEGETVRIVGDGAPYRNQTVTNGRVTVDGDELPITNAVVGLDISPLARTIEPEFATPDGITSFGKRKRWVRVAARTVDTLTIEFNGVQQPERDTEDLMGFAVPTPSEFDFMVYNLEYEEKGILRLGQTAPLPACITGVFGVVEVGDQ